jgi:hypothetical protein
MLMIVRIARQVLHEGLIHLEPGYPEMLQRGERGVAGAEIVDRHLHAEGLQFLEDSLRELRVMHHRILGDFQFQIAGIEAGVAERGGHRLLEAGLAELSR